MPIRLGCNLIFECQELPVSSFYINVKFKRTFRNYNSRELSCLPNILLKIYMTKKVNITEK